MAETMYEEAGVGLAAPQVGCGEAGHRLRRRRQSRSAVQSVIVEASEETAVDEEGCLSVPGVTVPIERSIRVVCNRQTIEDRR